MTPEQRRDLRRLEELREELLWSEFEDVFSEQPTAEEVAGRAGL